MAIRALFRGEVENEEQVGEWERSSFCFEERRRGREILSMEEFSDWGEDEHHSETKLGCR